jgi:hypothetical protein
VEVHASYSRCFSRVLIHFGTRLQLGGFALLLLLIKFSTGITKECADITSFSNKEHYNSAVRIMSNSSTLLFVLLLFSWFVL